MGIAFSDLKAAAARERRDQEARAAFNPETIPAPRWGDVGWSSVDRKAPWLRGWIRVIVALVSVLAIFAVLVWLVLWWGAAVASGADK